MVTRLLLSGTYVQNPLAAGVQFPMTAARGSFGGDKKQGEKSDGHQERRDKRASIAAVIHRLGFGTNDWCEQGKSADH